MKRSIKIITPAVIFSATLIAIFSQPAFAASDCAILLSAFCDGDLGGLLTLIINILTGGIVVAGTIGIIWFGRIILMARDDVSEVAKAKKRLLEVVVGLAMWSIAYAGASFFIPGFYGSLDAPSVAGLSFSRSDSPSLNDLSKISPGYDYGPGTTSPGSGGSSTPSTPSTPSDPSTPSGPSTVAAGDLPIGPLTQSSDNIDCDPRTTFYKKYPNAHTNGVKISITLCQVPNINGSNIVNSRVSGAYYAIADAYQKATGKTLTGSSSFRSYEDQEYFYSCYVNCNCNNCNLAAAPGTSKHEGGYAIDFEIPAGSTSVSKVTSCASTSNFGSVTDRQSPNRWYYAEISRWFCNNLGSYGMTRPVSNEVWHVNPTSSYY